MGVVQNQSSVLESCFKSRCGFLNDAHMNPRSVRRQRFGATSRFGRLPGCPDASGAKECPQREHVVIALGRKESEFLRPRRTKMSNSPPALGTSKNVEPFSTIRSKKRTRLSSGGDSDAHDICTSAFQRLPSFEFERPRFASSLGPADATKNTGRGKRRHGRHGATAGRSKGWCKTTSFARSFGCPLCLYDQTTKPAVSDLYRTHIFTCLIESDSSSCF